MTEPTQGALYRLKQDANLLKEDSLFSKPLNDGRFFGGGTIVMFVEMSPSIQKMANTVDRSRDDRYRFMKLVVGDQVGWCPFFVASSLTTDGHWQFLEPLDSQEQ